MDTEKTIVVFRTFPARKRTGCTQETVAIFPELPHDVRGYQCMIYAHVGQHGGGDRFHIIDGTRAATPEEIAPLARELAGIGYNLEPRLRITAAMDEKRRNAARR